MFLLFGQDDDLVGRRRLDRFEDLRGRRVHRLAAGDDLLHAEASGRCGGCRRRSRPRRPRSVTGSARRRRLVGATPRLAHPALLLDLLEQVGDADVARPAGSRCAASIAAPMSSVWMWQFQMPSPPTTTIESPMPAHTSLNAGIVVVGRLEEVHDLVAQVADVAVAVRRRRPRRRIGRRGPSTSRLGHGPAVDDVRGSASSSSRKPGAAGVDDAGVAAAPAAARACAPSGVGAAGRGRVEHVDRAVAAVAGRRSARLGGLADDGEDRALDRAHHRLVGGVGGRGAAPRRASAPSTPSASANAVGEAPQDLRRITPELPRAPISEPWLIALQTSAMSASAPPSSAHHRLERERHVRAGVAVGHRVDVEPVEPSWWARSASR